MSENKEFNTKNPLRFALGAVLLILAAVVIEICTSCAALEKRADQAAAVATRLAATKQQMQRAYQCAMVAETCIQALSENAETAPPSETIQFIQACSDAWRELQCEALINELLNEGKQV